MRAIIISVSSDIGSALASRWLARGWTVWGTYLTFYPSLRSLRERGARLIKCDLTHDLIHDTSIYEVCKDLRRASPWDVLVLLPGAQDPIGPFVENRFGSWRGSLEVNFIGPMEVIHKMLPTRGPNPTVVMFSGGGTNSAPPNYSAYTVSKIALIKMAELLDAELPDVKFTVLGPGWVRTKIHDQTLRAGSRAGPNFATTQEMLDQQERWTPMERVLDCIDWVIQAPRAVVGGRNISVAHDPWDTPEFEWTASLPDSLKLRRRAPWS